MIISHRYAFTTTEADSSKGFVRMAILRFFLYGQMFGGIRDKKTCSGQPFYWGIQWIIYIFTNPYVPVRPRGMRESCGQQCRLCASECSIGEGEYGFCGLRTNREGTIEPLVPHRSALAYSYLDPLPTNCCAAWFCPGSHKPGYNIAVFFYGCNFNCLFCQNALHKRIRTAP